MLNLTTEIKGIIREARKKTILNAWDLLKTSIEHFENNHFTIACFLAMTAIEEIGKLFVLQMVQGDIYEGLKIFGFKDIPKRKLNEEKLNKFLKSHTEKAIEAAARSLFINSGADRRHGVDSHSNMIRTSGVVLLARSGYWMTIRNNCLYTDINFSSRAVISPEEFISREHAYYFICMGFEILAEQAETGFGSVLESTDVITSVQFWQDRIKDLEVFIKHWSSTVNLDKLDFLANPDPLQKEAEKRESRKSR